MTPLPDNLPKERHPHLSNEERLLAVYLRTLSSPQTKKTYNTEIRAFLSYTKEKLGKKLEEITPEDISLYREHVTGRYSPATAAKKLTALRRFLTFCYMGGISRVNPEALKFFAKSPRVRQDPSYNILTEEELSRMLSAARAESQRDYVLLAVMAGCGLREAEVGLEEGLRRTVGWFMERGRL